MKPLARPSALYQTLEIFANKPEGYENQKGLSEHWKWRENEAELKKENQILPPPNRYVKSLGKKW